MIHLIELLSFPGNSGMMNPPGMQETQVLSLGWEDPLEKEMATLSSILAQKTPRKEEPGGLQSMRSQRFGHNLLTKQQHIKLLFVGFLWPLIFCSVVSALLALPSSHLLLSPHCGLACAVTPGSLRARGLQPARLWFFRQEYWSGLPFLSLGALPNPGNEPTALASPVLAGRFLTSWATGMSPKPRDSAWHIVRVR